MPLSRLAGWLLATAAATSLLACGVKKPQEVVDAATRLPDRVDFNWHVRPILSDKCFACHGPDANERKAGLRLDTEAGAFGELPERPGSQAVVPGSLRRSRLWHRIVADDPAERMPPADSHLELSADEIATLARWIEQGAAWKSHWAFIPPNRPEPPEVDQAAAVHNPIDRFVLDGLNSSGEHPEPPADRERLLRRATLDLTGLPPTVAQIDSFLADGSPDAYERAIDRLLSSPHFGERMTTDWLDVARFADTHGYTVDRYRDASPWRDWVIDAFNRNMPFDTFVTWQLAGDLLEEPTREQLLATGFNRLHAQNAEGGIVNEEFRVEYVADRTQTFGTAFLGLTLQCARCHDHKYDPLSQKEFYELFSFFNNVDESGQISYNDAMPVPTMLWPDQEQETALQDLRTRIDSTERALQALAASAEPRFRDWLERTSAAALSEPPDNGRVAYIPLERVSTSSIPNRARPNASGSMIDPVTGRLSESAPQPVPGRFGNGLRLSGDDALYFPKVGVFNRAEPFSISLWVTIPDSLSKGVILHKNEGGILYNFRGYYLSLEDGKLHLCLAHTFPYNSIHVVSLASPPTNRWTHLAVTYDGSSRARGVGLFVDGEKVPVTVRRDRLYKDILLDRDVEPGLKIGARNRSKGFTGGGVDEIAVYDRVLTSVEVAALADRADLIELWSDGATAGDLTRPSPLREHYLLQVDRAYAAARSGLQSRRDAERRLAQEIPEVMITREMSERRPAYVLERGAYDTHGEEVAPATPVAVLPMPEEARRNRLGLAEWLTAPENPLFARVTVNRLWQQFFGRGIVATPEDFGNQGRLPSHPELLDWLAVEFRESKWDVKHLVRLIVTSATYRQSSIVDAEKLGRDPENTMLARGPARRLSAEMLRDHALASSGLLAPRIGGPSVKPYQPDGLWRVNGANYVQDRGEALYRRSLYTFIKRTVPPPTLNLFDAPDRAYCVVRRQKTTNPLQSLALMNDPQFLEAARVTAERAVRDFETDTGGRIVLVYRLLTGRFPLSKERDLLTEQLDTTRNAFAADPDRARNYLAIGASPVDRTLPATEVAATMVIVSTVMNSDAFVMLR